MKSLSQFDSPFLGAKIRREFEGMLGSDLVAPKKNSALAASS